MLIPSFPATSKQKRDGLQAHLDMLPVRALATAASSKVTIWHPRARLKTS